MQWTLMNVPLLVVVVPVAPQMRSRHFLLLLLLMLLLPYGGRSLRGDSSKLHEHH
jgi:hypothetical protein